MRILVILLLFVVGISCHQGAIDDEIMSGLDSSNISIASGDKVQDFYSEYNSEFIRQETPDPLVIEAGSFFRIDVEYKNIGTETWYKDEPPSGPGWVTLYSESNPKNLWGIVEVELPNDVAPGETVEIKIRRLKAPSTPGIYYMQWQLSENSYQLVFGEKTDILEIEVVPD